MFETLTGWGDKAQEVESHSRPGSENGPDAYENYASIVVFQSVNNAMEYLPSSYE
jgi:hypothetical protein